MKKTTYLSLCTGIAALALFPFRLQAQTIEQVYLNTGSVVKGYISTQKPGVYFTVHSEEATLQMGSDSLVQSYTTKLTPSELSDSWKRWAEMNHAYQQSGNSAYLELSNLKFKHSEYNGVYVLERGSLIKFIDFTSSSYTFPWKELFHIVKIKRAANQFSGIKDVLVLANGERYEGQITEQYPGKTIKIETEGHKVFSFKFSDIKQIVSEPLNDTQDLWQQTQFLDKIQLKNGNGTLEGFIVARTLDKDIRIQLPSGEEQIVPIKNIQAYHRLANPEFQPLVDQLIPEGEVWLNGKKAYFDTLQIAGQSILLGELVSAIHEVGDTVRIEAKFRDPHTQVSVIKASNIPVRRKNEKGKEKEVLWPAFTYQDIVRSPLAYEREQTPLGNTRIRFQPVQRGDYVVYIQGYEGYIVIHVADPKKQSAIQK